MWLKIFLAAMISVTMLSCSIEKSYVAPKSSNPDLVNFENESDLVLVDGVYWDKTVGSNKMSLGAVYERYSTNVNNKKYLGLRFVSPSAFNKVLPQSNIDTDNSYLFQIDNEISIKNDNGVEIMAAVASNISYASDVVYKLNVNKVSSIKPPFRNLSTNTKFCNDKFYLISSTYSGDSSYYGLSAVTWKYKVMGVYGSGEGEGYEKTKLHKLKTGTLYYKLAKLNDTLCVGNTNFPNTKALIEDMLRDSKIKAFKLY